ncbi:MAG: molybdenum cofactor biosynthesis protein MoaE [Thermoplasmata archaeon]|nr:molybdenum cofactor biosynthesis protein MoaE [Thermoplasmata archaeon]
MFIKVSNDRIEIEKLISMINNEKNGAIVTFIGTVRDSNEGKNVTKIIYDAYLPMAEIELEKLLKETKLKFNILDACVHHRIGEFYPGEIVVFIAVSSEHREEAFNACKYIIDRIKETVPIWKKEFYGEESRWL